MTLQLAVLAFVGLSFAAAADKPRVFITESGANQLSGEATVADTRSTLNFTGATSTENIEVIKAFSKQCPEVIVTSSREKADFVIRFDREGVNPTTLFVRGNKVAVFNRDQDLIYSNSTRLLNASVKGACSAVTSKK